MGSKGPTSPPTTLALGARVDRILLEKFREICRHPRLSQGHALEVFLDFFVNHLSKEGRLQLIKRHAMIRTDSETKNPPSQ